MAPVFRSKELTKGVNANDSELAIKRRVLS